MGLEHLCGLFIVTRALYQRAPPPLWLLVSKEAERAPTCDPSEGHIRMFSATLDVWVGHHEVTAHMDPTNGSDMAA